MLRSFLIATFFRYGDAAELRKNPIAVQMEQKELWLQAEARCTDGLFCTKLYAGRSRRIQESAEKSVT